MLFEHDLEYWLVHDPKRSNELEPSLEPRSGPTRCPEPLSCYRTSELEHDLDSTPGLDPTRELEHYIDPTSEPEHGLELPPYQTANSRMHTTLETTATTPP